MEGARVWRAGLSFPGDISKRATVVMRNVQLADGGQRGAWSPAAFLHSPPSAPTLPRHKRAPPPPSLGVQRVTAGQPLRKRVGSRGPHTGGRGPGSTSPAPRVLGVEVPVSHPIRQPAPARSLRGTELPRRLPGASTQEATLTRCPVRDSEEGAAFQLGTAGAPPTAQGPSPCPADPGRGPDKALGPEVLPTARLPDVPVQPAPQPG